MKAILARRYGPPDVLACEEVERPAPGDDEVLVRVLAAALNPVDRVFRGDSLLLRLLVAGLRAPKDPRMGHDLAGEVVAVGSKVTRFAPGDAVFGVARGAFAEYACAAATRLARKPERITFEQAAGVTIAGLTALQGLRDKGRLEPGQRVLINGAGGGVGTFAVQIAKALGAHVTAVTSTENLQLVRSLSADATIDYTREDFTRGAARYDLVFDIGGTHTLRAMRRVLTPNGACVLAGGPKTVSAALARALAAIAMSRLGRQRFVMFIAKIRPDDLEALRQLMERGAMTPVLDRRYRLDEVADAFRYLEQGHARGKVVITGR